MMCCACNELCVCVCQKCMASASGRVCHDQITARSELDRCAGEEIGRGPEEAGGGARLGFGFPGWASTEEIQKTNVVRGGVG